MNEFLFFISFALGVATALALSKLAHSSALAHYEQVFYNDVSDLKTRLKALETPAPKGK